MTKLKKIILLNILFSFSLCFVMAQNVIEPGYTVKAVGTTQVANVYVPPATYPQSLMPAAQINVDFIGSWTLDAMAAYDFAVDIWEQIITSTVPIEVTAEFTSLSGSTLAEGGPFAVASNFNTTDPQFQLNTLYPLSLANRMAGVDLAPAYIDVVTRFSDTVPFYYGTDGACPAGMYDFVTLALHEIGHGLGFFPSIDEVNSSEGEYGIDVGSSVFQPTIHDRFVVDGNGTRLTDFPMGVPSTTLYDFFLSDDLFWDGSDAFGTKLYAPTTFNEGSTISHFDEATYSGTPNALMTPAFAQAEAIHDPGPLGVGVLRDIGWEAELVIGFEDDLNIHGFDQWCYENISNCPVSQIPNDLITPAKTEYNLGETGYYCWTFEDELPSTAFYSADWRLELLHSQGRYTYSTGSAPPWFNNFEVTIANLPAGYQWERNMQGQIEAHIIISGTDGDGVFHEEFLPIVINYQPDTPNVEFLSGGIGRTCKSVVLAFYAPGATSYNVLFKPSNQSYYVSQQVSAGQFSHQITGLDETRDYDFIVEGINSQGASSSGVLTRRKCKIKIRRFNAFPNPARTSVMVTYPDGGVIKQVNVYNVSNNNLELSMKGDNYSNEINLNIESLPVGTYDIEVIDNEGQATNQIIFKY